MKRFICVLAIFGWGFSTLWGQSDTVPSVYRAQVIHGDTTFSVCLDSVYVVSRPKQRSAKYQRRYRQLEKKVVKVYPYARAAGEVMQDYEAQLAVLDKEKERKVYIEEKESELKNQFEGDLRKLTISEGVILIKLIDRETGENSYSLIKEMKGGFSAFMWQSVARLFGHNLKDEYDAEGDDEIIEEIIGLIEDGTLCTE